MDFTKLSHEFNEILENLKAAEEFDQLCKEAPEQVKSIMLDGMKTQFWKYLKGCMTRTLFTMQLNLKGKTVNTQDDLVLLGKFNAIQKQTDELLNFPDNVVKTLSKVQAIKKP